jgi:hypothetical protein
MTRSETHRDVEFIVSAGDTEQTFRVFDKALMHAFSVALAEGEVTLDVLVYSEEGAEWFNGEAGVERYESDPEASVFQRFKISVADLGQVA